MMRERALVTAVLARLIEPRHPLRGFTLLEQPSDPKPEGLSAVVVASRAAANLLAAELPAEGRGAWGDALHWKHRARFEAPPIDDGSGLALPGRADGVFTVFFSSTKLKPRWSPDQALHCLIDPAPDTSAAATRSPLHANARRILAELTESLPVKTLLQRAREGLSVSTNDGRDLCEALVEDWRAGELELRSPFASAPLP